MSDLSSLPPSLSAKQAQDVLTAVQTAAASKFVWPLPPALPAQNTPLSPEDCELEGMNGKVMQARLLEFDLASQVVQVQVPAARRTLPVQFAQFRRLTLTRPLDPSKLLDDADAVQALFGGAHEFRITLAGGSVWTGKTLGHVEAADGLFLFLPRDGDGTLQRVFCPRTAYEVAELGAGPVLAGQARPTGPTSSAFPHTLAALRAKARTREERIGDALLSDVVSTPEQLQTALAAQARMPMVRIGEALIALGYIDQAQLDTALSEQRIDRSIPLGELLVRNGAVERNGLRTALVRKMGYPIVDVDAFPVELDALRLVSSSTALNLNVLPLQWSNGRLVVAIDDPSRHQALAELEFLCQGKVLPVLASTDILQGAIQATYRRHGQDDGASSLVTLEEHEEDISEDAISQSDNSLVRLINSIIVEAHTQRVSDIHIETRPGREKVHVRFRRDGELMTHIELPSGYRSALIARLKVMCDLDISERRRPQDGKINFARFVPSCAIELRLATIPTNNGLEDAVMRILASAEPIPLDNLGMSPYNLTALKRAIERPYGMVLCVGPTGSGKTTTLHSALSYINKPERKIWTAEDPIEITQPGLRQVQVNPKIDWTFAKALRAFLRADPDVIMVGEIRDGDTARIAVESSLTGHLVLSTLHTNSAAETVTRLLDMGMDPFNFADSLLAVMAQRLVRRLCTGCRVAEAASDETIEMLLGENQRAWGEHELAPSRDDVLAGWMERFAVDGKLQSYRCTGCKSCEGKGLRGRAGLHELLVVSRAVKQLIQTGTRAEVIQQVAMGEGLRTLRQDGLDKVLMGVTTIEEVHATSNN